MNVNITISDAASSYIKKALEKSPGNCFRLSVKKTGCSGYSYAPAVVAEVPPKDIVLEANGVTFFIDSAWVDILQGVHIDYVEEEKSGLKQKRLIFSNPNEANRCGCGESFHVS